jgi:hypothetical protein
MTDDKSEFEQTMGEIWDGLVPSVGADRAHELLAKLRSCLPDPDFYERDPEADVRTLRSLPKVHNATLGFTCACDLCSANRTAQK